MPFNETRQREIGRETCLLHFAGRDSIFSGVFDATGLVADSNGRFLLPIGTPLSRSSTDPTKCKAYAGGGSDTDEVQTVTVSGSPTGGSFTLTVFGQTTAAIAYNATAAQVEDAIEALDIAGEGNIVGGGGALPATPVTVQFTSGLGHQDIPQMVADGSGLTGGTSPKVAITTTTPGTTAEKVFGIFDGPDRDYFGNALADQEPIPVYFHACTFDIRKIKGWGTNSVAIKAGLPTCDFIVG